MTSEQVRDLQKSQGGSPTVVGAGGRVLGAGPADDVLMDLEPVVLVGTPAEQMPDSPHHHGNHGNGW